MKIGEALRREFVKHFWTQERPASEAGIPRKQLSLIEGDKGKPRFSTIRKLASALGVEPQDLLKDS